MIRAAVAGTGLVGACVAIARVPNLVESPALFLGLFSLAFLGYAAGIRWLPAGSGPGSVTLVVGVAVMARLALLPAAPTLSTDAYRYVWDARVAGAGLDPYVHPPAAPELAALRDGEVFPRLNHPTWRTIYPPGAQAFFQLVYRLRPDSVRAMKLAIGLAELVGLAAVMGLLRAGGRGLAQTAIYAWNPLLLVEVWGAGHLDGLVVPVVAGAAWSAVRGRHALTGALLGAGTLVKLYPAALLPLLPVAAWPSALAAFGAVVAAGYAPTLLAGIDGLGSLPRYLAEEYFNPGLARLLAGSPAVSAASAMAWAILVSATRREVALPARAVTLIGGLVLLSPNIFPWYVIWLLPFLAWEPSIPWIAFSGTVAFAYAFFVQDPWAIPSWARAIEFAPLGLGALWWCARRMPGRAWTPSAP